MKSTLYCYCVFFVVVLTSCPAWADSTDAGPVVIKLHYMPSGHAYVVPDVGEVRYYKLSEYKLLLKLDNDHYWATKTLDSLKENAHHYQELIDANFDIVLTYKKERDVYKDRWLRIQDNWIKSEEELQLKTSRIDWPSIFIGGGIGVMVGVVATAVVVVSVQ